MNMKVIVIRSIQGSFYKSFVLRTVYVNVYVSNRFDSLNKEEANEFYPIIAKNTRKEKENLDKSIIDNIKFIKHVRSIIKRGKKK